MIVFKYLKNNFIKCAPLLFFSFVFTLVFLYSFSIMKTNDLLKTQIQENVTYNIEAEGRLFSATSSDSNIFSGSDYPYNEFNNVKNVLESHNISYDLIQEIKSGYANSIFMYGIDGVKFFNNREIELIENKNTELNFYDVIVPDSLYININTLFPCTYRNIEDYLLNYYKKVDIGDVIRIPLTTNTDTFYNNQHNDSIEFRVVGIYKEKSININEFNNLDYELNNRIYVSKDTFLDFLNTYLDSFTSKNLDTIFNYIYFGNVSNTRFINLDFNVDGYEETRNLRYSLMEELGTYNTVAASRANYELYKFYSTEDLIDIIIKPFTSLSENINIYKDVSIIVSFLVFGLLILVNMRKRINEFSIKMSIGMKYISVMFELLIEDVVIVLIGSIISIIVYNQTVVNVVGYMLQKCINLQNNLYKVTSKDIQGLGKAFTILNDFSNCKVGYEYYLMVIAICVLITLMLTIVIYKTNQPKNVKKALMSS